MSEYENSIIKLTRPAIEFDLQYIRGELIGKGHFGNVYKCFSKQIENKTVYALKIVSYDVIHLKYISKEIKLNRFLKDQAVPNACYAVEIFYSKKTGEIYLLLQFCNGGTLESKICKQHVIPEDEAQYIIRKLLTCLCRIHKEGFMHRDIKPANILLHYPVKKCDLLEYGNYEVLLGDFGFSIETEQAKTVVGTPITMAPEVKAKKKYQSSADLWSLGIVLFDIVMGRFPFKDRDHLANPQNSTIQIPVSRCLSLACLSFIEICLQYDKSKRTCAEKLLQHPFLIKDVPNYLKMPITDLCSSEDKTIDHNLLTHTQMMNELMGKYSDK